MDAPVPPAAEALPAPFDPADGILPAGFIDERYDPLALRDATAALEPGLPIETDLTELYALRNPWRPRQLVRAARRDRIFEEECCAICLE
eukprot:13541471-Alexandrium_andersonii.AAC.1